MIPIHKGTEPKSLREYRENKNNDVNCSYKNFRDKDKVRETLVREQGYLCAYCMQEITSDEQEMKIEHWHSQSKHSDEQLDYQNMLACCKGGEGNIFEQQYCDTAKGNQSLKYNPSYLQHHILLQIKYKFKDGEIYSEDKDFNPQLNDVLNLNLAMLKNNRKTVIDSIMTLLAQQNGTVSAKFIQSLLERYTQKSADGKFPPYCGIVRYYLEKKLKSHI